MMLRLGEGIEVEIDNREGCTPEFTFIYRGFEFAQVSVENDEVVLRKRDLHRTDEAEWHMVDLVPFAAHLVPEEFWDPEECI